jgi:hypothetical protein
MKWTVRNVFSTEDRLRNIPYPDPLSQIQPDPIAIQVMIPDNLFISVKDDVKVGVWDEREQVWSTAEIEEFELHQGLRKLDFTTRKLA